MASNFFCNFCSISPLFFILLFSSLKLANASNLALSSYIVVCDGHSRPSAFSTQGEWHAFMVNSVTDHMLESPSTSRIFYTYDVVIQGFASRMTDEEADKLMKLSGVIGVFKDTVETKPHTTQSPEFLGLNIDFGLWPETNYGDNVIIGFVDTGIWPESESFGDGGLGPIPSGWKGSCQFNSSFCNKKLIGAWVYSRGFEHYASTSPTYFGGDYQSPRDEGGHGTHTASTAAGAAVPGASMFGFADGTARGIATKARIAMYKACHFDSCAESDVLAAVDRAILDGVNVLSLSIGRSDAPHYENAVNLGAFAAMKRGIFVTGSAGNYGPHPYSVQNTAPWITTVGAGSVDRSFPVKILLGNDQAYVGSSLYLSNISSIHFSPLLYLGDCDSIDTIANDVTGKIIVCNGNELSPFNTGFFVQDAGGVGLIRLNPKDLGEGLMAAPFKLPASTVGFREGQGILAYINRSENPTAMFVFSNLTSIGKDRAPMVASFSSRGPNPIVPEILKPDLLAPGLNILAAFADNLAPTWSPYDSRRVNFNILSGTSMACPHVAGAAALLRVAHPHWSPAAIRSALMTTSGTIDNEYRPISRYEDMAPATALGIGAGHINPQLAADPGLIYDADVSDYINFLCSLNFTRAQMKLFVEGPYPCSGVMGSPSDLNYPSFSLVFKPKCSFQELKRKLKNVGELLPETYRVRIINPGRDKVTITVEPSTLTFNSLQETQSYTARFESNFVGDNNSSFIHQMVFGSIAWESDRHIVRTPIAIMWN